MAPQPSTPLRLTAKDAKDAAAPMEDGSWIDVLVFYTPEAKQEDAGGDAAIIELLADLMIVHTNPVYPQSGVAHRLRFAAPPMEAEPLREADFRSSNGMLLALSEWERGRELRDRYAADLVTLMFRGKGLADTRARAFINLPDRVTADEALPFSVTCSDCTRAFPHEIGHNFRLRHDRYEWKQAETPGYLLIDPPHPEAFGFARPFDGDPDTDCIVTIMATGLECVDDGFLQAVRFSNPERKTLPGGTATGIPGTKPSAKTNGPPNPARHMNRMGRYAVNSRRAPCLSRNRSLRLHAANGQYVNALRNCAAAVRADQRRPWPHGMQEAMQGHRQTPRLRLVRESSTHRPIAPTLAAVDRVPRSAPCVPAPHYVTNAFAGTDAMSWRLGHAPNLPRPRVATHSPPMGVRFIFRKVNANAGHLTWASS